MAIFEGIDLEWEGRKYSIPEDRVLPCIARVEDIVSVPELSEMYQSGRFKFAKIAQAYAALLRMAGAKDVTDLAVHRALFPTGEGKEIIAGVMAKIETLMMLMTPPDYLVKQAQPAKKEEAAKP